MYKVPTFRFLLFLSQIHLFMLIFSSIDSIMLDYFSFKFRDYSTICCKLYMFFTYFFGHLSSVLQMVVSIERVFVVYRKNIACFKLSFIKKFIGLIVLALVFLNSHYLFFYYLSFEKGSNLTVNINVFKHNFLLGFNIAVSNISDSDLFETQRKVFNQSNTPKDKIIDQVCYPENEEKYIFFLNKIWSWTDILVYSFIPFVIMIVCSALIIVKIRINSKQFSTNTTNQEQNQRRNRRDRSALYMLISTNLFFLICSLPFSILNNKLLTSNTQVLYFSQIFSYCEKSLYCFTLFSPGCIAKFCLTGSNQLNV